MTHEVLSDAATTVTVERVESGVKTSPYSKPGPGMTTLALFFKFQANEAGGSACSFPTVFGPDGTEYDGFYGAVGKYEQDWGCTELRPGSPRRDGASTRSPGRLRRGRHGRARSDGEQFSATWVVTP